MSQRVARGNTIVLDAFYRDGTGALVAPVNPTIQIFDPNNVLIVGPVTPTFLSLGHYEYSYSVPALAPLGAWTAHWCGVINGVSVCDNEQWDVVDGGSISFQSPGAFTCEPWATTTDVCTPCDDYAFDSLLLMDCLQAASDVLFQLSGRQFPGTCQATVRPCAQHASGDRGRPIPAYSPYGTYWPVPGSWSWSPSWGFCSCNRTERTGCGSIAEITLGAYPIQRVTEVRMDGVVLPSSEYRVDDDRYLVRLADANGNAQGWPCCQRMDLPTTEVGTWEVTFLYGQPPPVAGMRAAARLGCELALACQPETVGACNLPERVTQITRQGVTAVVLDPMAFLDEGKTGLYEVDLFLRSVNPNKLSRRSTVLRPDKGRRVRRTGD